MRISGLFLGGVMSGVFPAFDSVGILPVLPPGLLNAPVCSVADLPVLAHDYLSTLVGRRMTITVRGNWSKSWTCTKGDDVAGESQDIDFEFMATYEFSRTCAPLCGYDGVINLTQIDVSPASVTGTVHITDIVAGVDHSHDEDVIMTPFFLVSASICKQDGLCRLLLTGQANGGISGVRWSTAAFIDDIVCTGILSGTDTVTSEEVGSVMDCVINGQMCSGAKTVICGVTEEGAGTGTGTISYETTVTLADA